MCGYDSATVVNANTQNLGRSVINPLLNMGNGVEILPILYQKSVSCWRRLKFDHLEWIMPKPV